MSTAFFHDERTLWHEPAHNYVSTMRTGGWVQPSAVEGFIDSPESKRRIKALMDVSGLTSRLTVTSAQAADEEDLSRVHSRSYLARFKAGSDAGGGELGPLAPYGPGGYEIAALSAGLATTAMESVVSGNFDKAYALTRPCGHHASRDTGMGFSLLNNIAIGIEAMKERHGLGKVAVIDWDVHHGNGTQQIFYARNDVLTVSLHQENCYPPGSGAFAERGENQGLDHNLNVPLLAGGGHAAYLYALERLVFPAVERFQPELIVVASGLDANCMDPLARMQLYPESFRQMTLQVRELASALCKGRLAMVHEGGYSQVCVPFCGLATLEALSGYRTEVPDPFMSSFAGKQPSHRFECLQREQIDEMAEAFGF